MVEISFSWILGIIRFFFRFRVGFVVLDVFGLIVE